MDDDHIWWLATPEYCRRKSEQHYQLATSADKGCDGKNYIHHLQEAAIWDWRSKQVKQS